MVLGRKWAGCEGEALGLFPPGTEVCNVEAPWEMTPCLSLGRRQRVSRGSPYGRADAARQKEGGSGSEGDPREEGPAESISGLGEVAEDL